VHGVSIVGTERRKMWQFATMKKPPKLGL
jgi:hypothetical protein